MGVLRGKYTKNSAFFASAEGEPEVAPDRVVEAAGGAVVGHDGRVLMIFRRGKWDLPKGHREPGESLRECALREVAEECGLKIAQLEAGRVLAVTEHRSAPDEIKVTTWYSMRYSGDPADAYPQTEEDITATEWVAPEEAEKRAETSYETIKTVIENFKQALILCNEF